MAGFIVGDGKRLYAARVPWRKPGTEGCLAGGVSAVAVDGRGLVYVLQRDPAGLSIYDQGRRTRFFAHPAITSGHGLHVDRLNRVCVTTKEAHQVLIFNANLELALELGSFNLPRWQEPFNSPTSVAVAADGEIYVADGYGNASIHRFDPKGNRLGSWGRPGRAAGEFMTPHAVRMLPDNRIACCDRDNDRIQIFDREGKWLATWPNFVRPMDIWGPDGGSEVFVSEQAPRISRVDLDGRILGRFNPFGERLPHSLCGDSHGNLYVAELGNPSEVVFYRRLENRPESGVEEA